MRLAAGEVAPAVTSDDCHSSDPVGGRVVETKVPTLIFNNSNISDGGQQGMWQLLILP